MIYTLIVILIAIIAVLLNIVVLLQSGEGGGLSGIAAGGATTQMIGQRRTADFLSKATSYLGGAFLVLCVVANFFIQRGGQTKSAIQTEANMPANTTAPSQTQPAVPAQNNAANNQQQKIPIPSNKGNTSTTNQGQGNQKPTTPPKPNSGGGN